MKTILGDEYPILVDRKLARILGVNEAMVMQHIHYWLVKNEEKKINYKEGRYWTFKSIKQWHDDEFDFWSESTLRRIFLSLEEKGLLIVGNFNKKAFDKTKWYSIDYEKLYSLDEEKNKENSPVEINKSVSKNETIQNEQMECSKLNKDNYSKWGNASSQVDNNNYSNWINADGQFDKTNTNNYKKNTNKDIKQPATNSIDYVKIEKYNETILKDFLEEEYTDEYAMRINDLLKMKGEDSAYLQEKIEFVKDMNPNSKLGYLYNAAKFDYKRRAIDFRNEGSCIRENNFGNNTHNNNKNKFKNFKETVYKYTPEELEERVREHNRRKYGEIV